MAEILGMKDGSFIVPADVFDVLDAVEEYMGVDVRQYLELHFMDGRMEKDDGDERDREFLEQLDGLVAGAMKMTDTRRIYRKDLRYELSRIHASIRHEIGEKDG